jgi:tetratricopeptide (TPR) repeat protein
MLNKINLSSQKQKLIVYIFLTLVISAVMGQVNQFDFVSLDDDVYVTENSQLQSGFTPNGLRWAFSTTYAEFWHPVTWLSLMFDYQLYGLNPAGYHLTNLILHILSTLLLFWFFNRMTGAVWKSAFVAALFALHPLRMESVAWIGERKDVLSAFFWMLTLCLYVYYTEKPVIRRYLLVVFSFVLALMSKPMVVTLPVIMILLDYWPLKRFESQKNNLILWQLKEKLPFFILSAVFSIITIYAQYRPHSKPISLVSNITNASVHFVTYLGKTFWPYDLAFYYPFSNQLQIWQVTGAILLILVISAAVIVMVKRFPYLFVGWLWYGITILPVIGVIPAGSNTLADRYTYLPSIGIAVILAWGIPTLFRCEDMRKKILFPTAIIFLAVLSVLTWVQCGYWRDSIKLFSHTLATKDNALAYNGRGDAYADMGQYKLAIEDYNKAISMKPSYAGAFYNRGTSYSKTGQYFLAIEDFNKTVIVNPYYTEAYNNRGIAYAQLGQYQLAIYDFSKTIKLQPDYVNAYNNRATVYFKQRNEKSACLDARRACELGNCRILEAAKGKGYCR